MRTRRLLKQSVFQLGMAGLLIAAAFFPAPAKAGEGDAGQPGAFLTYGAGARAMAMGRAFTGLADDATAVYWNPAGLSALTQNQVIVQYVSLVDGNNYQYLGYNHILPYIGTLGVGLIFLNQGEAEGRSSYNEVLESFTHNQLGVMLGFGSDITPQLAAGGTLKIVSQTLMNISGTGFGLDAGLMYHPWPFLNTGLTFRNLLAPAIQLKEEKEQYPMNLVLGVGVKVFEDKVKADLDVAKNLEQDVVKLCLGLEVSPIPRLFLRAGIDDTEIGMGAGYQYQGFQLDYALGFPIFQTVEIMHKVALSYYFGGFIMDVKAEPEIFSPVGINKVSVLKINCQTKFPLRIWSLEIRNEAKTLVKKYSGEGSPPDHVVWDGLLDNTNPMPDGRYQVTLAVVDASGGTKKSADIFVNIQSILPLGVSPVEMLE